MMKFKLSALIGALLLSSAVQATEYIEYSNKPITIQLHEGEERTIQFGDHVAVGVTPKQEAQGLFRVQSAQGALHILPRKTFDRERIQVKRLGDGKIVLIDLVSIEANKKDQTPLEDIRIYVGNEAKELPKDIETAKEEASGETNANQKEIEPITPITLTRQLAQKLYAPERLHKVMPGISEVSLNEVLHKDVRAFKGINRAKTTVRPILAYRSGNLYATALLVSNTGNTPVQLNYLDINIPFTHATYQHHKLNPKGRAGDRTVLYVINERPLSETLVPWTYYSELEVQKAKEAQQSKKKASHDASGEF
ncbi:MAG: TIGR03749 family integrating conjugative element protein [Thiotrichales bacterium]|nr:TIGR03749 family integrating conjugative element protein [Thiotrichales bacterium]